MTRYTVILVGLSGIGKSTFANALAKRVNIEVLSASEIIRRTLEAETKRKWTKEEMRLANTETMQKALIKGFKSHRQNGDTPILVDAHTIIDKGTHIEIVKPEFFQSLGADLIVHLTASPEEILARREADTNRLRPSLNIKELASQQTQSIEQAAQIGIEICKPSIRIENDAYDKVAKILYSRFERST